MSSATLPPQVVEVAPGFWNIRGSFKIAGLIDVGTHCSLVRRASGSFVFLDACELSDATHRWVEALTDGGERIEAVLHLHPFHTLHVKSFAASFPRAKLHGTARHLERFAELPWQALRTEDAELHAELAGDFELTVPRGMELVPEKPNLHFSSVLAIHTATKTLHVDDTLVYFAMPRLLRALRRDALSFHPTLAKVLERRAGAARDFRDWARELVERAKRVDNLCAAHVRNLLSSENRGASISERIERALAKVEPKLAAHERRHG